ncbi:MAG: hypothetical protein QGI09_12325, partial [Dehalococcoidia bacterium]|nr:hypothetical protein [Dehalococcoidia bacterium]
MENLILGGLALITVLMVVLAFLMFLMLSSTRKSVEGAKDVMSDRALKTMEEINELDRTLQTITHQQE